MEALKVCIKAPTAHFTIPYVSASRKTYPIPPFSTAIGILCNILKDEEKIRNFTSSPLKMAIVGNYESITYEYTWLRSFDASFVKNMGSFRRKTSGEIEHPGQQIPDRVQTLVNSSFCIYTISPSNEEIFRSLEEGRSISHIHAGRSEDIVSDIEWSFVELEQGPVHETFGYTWLPRNIFPKLEDYDRIYEKVIAPVEFISTIYRISNGRRRIFKNVQAKLYKGAVPMVSPWRIFKGILDSDVPVFFTEVVRG